MKNVINFCSFLSIIALLGFTTTATAQQKIAHVNSDEIIQMMPEYKQAKANVESFGKVLQKQLEAQQKEVQDYYNETAQKAQELSPIQVKEAEANIARMQQELQTKAQEADQALVLKEQELIKPLYEKFETAIEKVASANGFSYIMDVKTALYSKGGIDATSMVKKELGL